MAGKTNIAILGYGIVGSGVFDAIMVNKDTITRSSGQSVQVKKVLDIRDFESDPVIPYLTHNFNDIVNDSTISIVVETIGGLNPAYNFVKSSLLSKKSVVTSNKELVATHGAELSNIAKQNGVSFCFEASVGGAMPIINFSKKTLPSSEIKSIVGILNGTTNFILSRMTSEGSSYKDTLEESKVLGIAETDPSQDVEGIDAACKTVILANSVLGIDCVYDDIEIEGITNITSQAIELAKKEGYFIKLIAEISKDKLKVAPRLVKKNSSYAIEGTLNMATLKTDLAGDVTVVGKGAGSIETASAILTDIINIKKTIRE